MSSDKVGGGGKGGKSALKYPSNGKGDDLAKSKSGRKVQFDYEDLDGKIDTPTKNGGKDDTPFAKGNGGKGGKGDKVSGKTNATKEPAPLVLNVEQELPENAKCLMDCEAAQMLVGIQEHMVMLSKDPTIRIPASFDRALQYANRSNLYSDPQSVRKILETLKKHGVSDGEICMIANTGPESVDEAFALVPSFKGKKNKLREPLKNALSDLEKLKSQS